MSRAALELYHDALLGHAVPTLSMLDREEHSPSHGCFDRTFWAWKFTDFPGARFQEGLCFLAYLHATPLPGSAYHGSEPLARWIAAGFDFWARIQRPAGDFDEAYPFEHSLAATAFTSFYLSEAWGFAGEALPSASRDRFRAGLVRAGDWLCRHDEHHGFLSNHLAAAAAALAHAHRITGEARFERRARHFVDKILAHQSQEGWYEEYGGADPGYQTHGLFYLARLWERTNDDELLASMRAALRFQAYFVHIDGSLGGEYTSRNTQTYYPAAFEMLRGHDATAQWIADTQRARLGRADAACLDSIDIYNFFPQLNNYVFAHRASSQTRGEPRSAGEPGRDEAFVHFRDAGLIRVRKRSYDAYVGATKGGVIKIVPRDAQAIPVTDCGFLGRTRKGRVLSTQKHGGSALTRADETAIVVDGSLFEVARPLMRPFRFVLFRLFSLTLGRFPSASLWLKRILVRVLIYRHKTLDARFRRTIEFTDDSITLRDELGGTALDNVDSIRLGGAFTTIHMGSSRYFIASELRQQNEPLELDLRDSQTRRSLEQGVTRTFEWKGAAKSCAGSVDT